MPAVTLVDYGLGNIQAFAHIYQRLNISVDIASTPEQLVRSQRLVLPGVGAFDWAMTRLNDSGMREQLDYLVLENGVPILGVCVGMQLMAKRSDEGKHPGLGWIDAEVTRLCAENPVELPLPHMGWNDVAPTAADTLFRNITSPRFYFLHSYRIVPRQSNLVLATASYGGVFTAAVRSRHVYGTQFHPEKSHQWGLELLRNFAEL